MIDITGILQAIIALISVVITAILIPYIRSRTTEIQQAKFQVWVNIAVRAAEQIYSATCMGDLKKRFALNFLDERGITYNSAVVNAAIEAAVKELDIQQGAVIKTIVEKPLDVDTDLLSGKYIV